MNKAVGFLKVITIILNTIFLLSSLAILIANGMPSLHPAFVIIPLTAPLVSITALVFANKLLSGYMWIVSIVSAIITNLVLTGTVIYCLASWGMPGLPYQNFLVPLWFVVPVISCTTLFLVRSRIKLMPIIA